MLPEPAPDAPATAEVAPVDLNGDGTAELAVTYPACASGGCSTMLYEQLDGTYRPIAFLQGELRFHEAWGGYLQVSATSRGGAESRSQCFNRYEAGRYRLYRIDRYAGATFTGTEWRPGEAAPP